MAAMQLPWPLTPEQEQMVLNAPAATPPPNHIPILDDPPNNNKLAIGVVVVCIFLASSFSILRVYSRVFCAGKVRIEDYMGVLGFVFYIGGACVLIRATSDAGLFVNMWNLRNRFMEKFLYEYVVTTILWCFAMVFVKAAIILEWTHIFIPRSTRNTFFWVCWAMLSVNTSLYVATVITTNLMCIPRERIWRRWVPGTCVNIDAFHICITVFHLVFDILLLSVPHKVIWQLSMSKKQKIGVSVIFSVGVFLCACAAGRVAALAEMVLGEDKSYAYSQYLLWGLGEATSTLLVFCAPAIPIIFNRSRRASKLKMSSSWSAAPRKHQSEIRQRPWPRIASNSASVDEYHRMHEGSATQLAPFEHNNSRMGSIKSPKEEEEVPLHSYLGILKTTEIEITTTTEMDLPITGHREEELRHPWREMRGPP